MKNINIKKFKKKKAYPRMPKNPSLAGICKDPEDLNLGKSESD